MYFGIDFGTSTICVYEYLMHSNDVRIVDNIGTYENGSFIDNVIYYEDAQQVILGETAIRKMMIDFTRGKHEIKKEIGGNFSLRINQNQKSVSEIIQDIFKEIKKKIETIHGGKAVEGVVITVPYAFNHLERQIIVQSAKKIGFNLIGLIEEPIAAAISTFVKNHNFQKTQNVVVFDFGGGTLDITVLKVTPKNSKLDFDLVITGGDKDLGGKNIDDSVYENLLEQQKISSNQIDQKNRLEIYKEIKQMKKSFNQDDSFDFYINLTQLNKALDLSVSIQQFNQLLKPIYARIKDIINNMFLSIDQLIEDDINQVIMVGGSSNISSLKDFLSKIFKNAEIVSDLQQSTLLVASGAAYYCGYLVNPTQSVFSIKPKTSYKISIIQVNQNSRTEMLDINQAYGSKSKTVEITHLSNRPTMIEVFQEDPINLSTIKVCSLKAEADYKKISINVDPNGMIGYTFYASNNHILKEGTI